MLLEPNSSGRNVILRLGLFLLTLKIWAFDNLKWESSDTRLSRGRQLGGTAITKKMERIHTAQAQF